MAPRGVYDRTTIRRKNFPTGTPKKKEKVVVRENIPAIEVLTDDDPTLGNVIKHITEQYHKQDTPGDKADYLARVYESMWHIDGSLGDDEP
jgi:translation initiation factor 2 beta subunit (eIF-2beta)/eIF-5